MGGLAAWEVERRVVAAREALAEAWLFPEGLAASARAIAALVPGCIGLIYFRERDGTFGSVGHDVTGKLASCWRSFPLQTTRDRLVPYIQYQLRGQEVTANRFVTLREAVGPRSVLESYVRDVHYPNGLGDLARFVGYRRGVMRIWCGVVRPRNDPSIGPHEVARLNMLTSDVRDLIHAADVTTYGKASPATTQVLMEQLDQPVWLVTPRGTIAFANAAARRRSRDHSAAARRAGSGDDPRFAVSRVTIGGDALALTIGRTHEPTRPVLPPSLARVAERVALGLTDKQIADELETSVSTIRTYVRRIYSRLGIHNRAQLAAHWER